MNSRLAPPPVLICEYASGAIWNFSIAATVSPPPRTLFAPSFVASATASAMAFVPLENLSISKTPTGPFHKIVLALRITSFAFAMALAPASTPSHPSGIADAKTTCVFQFLKKRHKPKHLR